MTALKDVTSFMYDFLMTMGWTIFFLVLRCGWKIWTIKFASVLFLSYILKVWKSKDIIRYPLDESYSSSADKIELINRNQDVQSVYYSIKIFLNRKRVVSIKFVELNFKAAYCCVGEITPMRKVIIIHVMMMWWICF